MDSHITYWMIMSAKVTKDFGLATYSFECNVLALELFVVLFTACDKWLFKKWQTRQSHFKIT